MSDQIDKQTNLSAHNQAQSPGAHSITLQTPPSIVYTDHAAEQSNLPVLRPFMAEERPCPHCGYGNHSHAPECYACGSRLQKKFKQVQCRYCHTRASNQLVLCPHCGQELLAASSAFSALGKPLLFTFLGVVLLLGLWQLGDPFSWANRLLQSSVSYIGQVSREFRPTLPTSSIGVTPIHNVADMATIPIDTEPGVISPALAVGPTDLDQIADPNYGNEAILNSQNVEPQVVVNLSPTPIAVAIATQIPPTILPEAEETATLEPIVIDFGQTTDTPVPDTPLPNNQPPVVPDASTQNVNQQVSTPFSQNSNVGTQDPNQPVGQLPQPPQPNGQQSNQFNNQLDNSGPSNPPQTLGTGGAIPPEPVFPTPIPPAPIPPTPLPPTFIPPTQVPPAYNPPPDPNVVNNVPTLAPPNSMPAEIAPTATPYPTLTSYPTLTPYPTATSYPTMTPTMLPTWTPPVQPIEVQPIEVQPIEVQPTQAVPTQTLPTPIPPAEVLPTQIPTAIPAAQPTPLTVVQSPDDGSEISIRAAGASGGIELYSPADDTMITNCQNGPTLSWNSQSPLDASYNYIVKLGFVNSTNGEVSWVIEKTMGIDQTSWQVDSTFCNLSRSEYGHQWRWNVRAVQNGNNANNSARPVVSPTWRFIWH